MSARSFVFAAALCVMSFVSAAEAPYPDIIPFKEGDPAPLANDGFMYCLHEDQPTYKTIEERVEVSPATKYVEKIAAVFEETAIEVVVRPEYKKFRYVPPEYKTVEEKVMVSPEYTTYEVVPPEFADAEVSVEIRPKSEIQSPAEASFSKVVEKLEVFPQHVKYLKTSCNGSDCYAAQTVPAQFSEIEKYVLDRGAAPAPKQIPAENDAVAVKKLVKPASVKEVKIPAKYETVQKQALVKPGEWVPETVAAVTQKVKKWVMKTPETERPVELPAKFAVVKKEVLDQPGRRYWKKVPIGSVKKDQIKGIVKRYKSMPGATANEEESCTSLRTRRSKVKIFGQSLEVTTE